MKRNLKKLKELVVYIAKRSEGDQFFGAVKLNKLLFYSDFLSYLKNGKPITASNYVRREFGPCPAGFKKISDAMRKGGDIAIQRGTVNGLPQQKTLALRDPDASMFSGEEIALVEQVLQEFSSHTGMEISDASHRFLGWKLAKEGERIPYSVALVNVKQPSLSDKTRAAKLVAIARKCVEHVPRS
jgi:hypothetical protein